MSYHSQIPKDWMVPSLFMHTPKAIKRGEPSDRIFAVVGITKDQGKAYYLAWKCTLLKDGRIEHPAFKRPLYKTDDRLYRKTSKNGSTPTAMFRWDSFYKLIPTEGGRYPILRRR